jgi:hypothetical protein
LPQQLVAHAARALHLTLLGDGRLQEGQELPLQVDLLRAMEEADAAGDASVSVDAWLALIALPLLLPAAEGSAEDRQNAVTEAMHAAVQLGRDYMATGSLPDDEGGAGGDAGSRRQRRRRR